MNILKFNDYLFESKQVGVIYHFTHLMNMYFILQDGIFQTRYNDLENYNYDYSISCTRNKSFKWGNVRIALDGNKISHKYVIKPVSYFKKINFRKAQMEERIFTNSETFPIFEYILQVDILNGTFDPDDEVYLFISNKLAQKNIKFNVVDKF